MAEHKCWIEELVSKNSQLTARNKELEERIEELEGKADGPEILPKRRKIGNPNLDEGIGRSRNGIFPQENPLLIASIVQNLFKHLSKWSLPPARLVCTIWNDEAKLQVEKRIRLIMSESNFHEMSKLVENSRKPFAGYRQLFLDFCESKMYHRYLGSLDKILSLHATNITHFTIRFEASSLWKIQNFRNLLLKLDVDKIEFLSFKTCPVAFFEVATIFPPGERQMFNKLKHLEIARVVQPRVPNCGFFVDLLHSAPNLESLNLNGRSTNKELLSKFPETVESLTRVRPAQLKFLNIFAIISNNEVTQLIDSGLDFEKLKLLNYRYFEVEFSTSEPPEIHPWDLNYGESYCVTIVEKLEIIMRNAFTTLENAGKVSCIQQLHTFQSTLDTLLIA